MTTTSRRALLGAVAAIGATSIIPAAAAHAAPGVRPAFLRKLARFRQLDELALKIDYDLETARTKQEAEQAEIPHVEWITPDDLAFNGRPMRYSTADKTVVNIARRAVDKPFTSDNSFQENLVKLAAAVDARDRALANVPSATEVRTLFDRCWRATDLVADAEMAFYRMPAVSIQELHLKVETAVERGGLEIPDVVRLIVADLRALAGEVA